MKRTLALLSLACLTFAPAAARSQTADKPQSAQPQTAKPQPAKPQTTKPSTETHEHGAAAGAVSAADHAFMREAAIGGMAEVELGRLASEKASSADVKQFGTRMTEDHGKANDELKSLAESKKVQLPAAVDAKHKATYDRLSKLSGAAFDRAYMTEMVADHNKDVAAFQKESTSASDAELKAWAAKTLPTLQEHQKLAKDVHAKVAGGAAKSPTKQPGR